MDKGHYLERLKERDLEKFNTYSYDLLPETFESTDKLPISCSLHGVFYQKPYVHLYNCGCPICGRLKSDSNRRNTTDAFILKAKEKFGDRFDYSKTIYTGQDTDVVISCKKHGDITTTPRQHLWLKYGCYLCQKDESLSTGQSELIEKAKQRHGDKYNYDKVNYKKFDDKVEIICPLHDSFWQSLYAHGHHGIGCPKCAFDKDRLTVEQFINKARSIHGDKYDYTKVVYNVNLDKVTITCKKHGDFIQRAGSHLSGNGCKQCFQEENRLSKEDFIKQAITVHGNKYDYSKVVYLQNKKHVEIVCPKHGSFWQKPNSHISKRAGCPICSESKGEKAVADFLTQYKIPFIREYRVLPYRYRYDFFLPELNIFIEYHGQQHYKAVDFFDGKQGFIDTLRRDKEKVEIVTALGGKIIVIPYSVSIDGQLDGYIKSHLKRFYACWLLVDGKLTVFKSVSEVYNLYRIPKKTPVKDLGTTLVLFTSNVKLLF